MSNMSHLPPTTGDQAFHLPKGVHVVAQATTLAEIDALADHLTAVACSVDDPLPINDLAAASIVVIEVDPASRNSLKRIDLLRNDFPHVPVIAGLAEVDIATSRQLLRRGVSDIIALPFSIDELVAAIVDTGKKLDEQGEARVVLAPFIAVLQTIGGSGSTTIATHLAAQMAKDMGEGRRACVIDLDLQSGDVASYLGGTPRMTLEDLLEAGDRLDEELVLSVAIQTHEMVDVIAPPTEIVPIESIDFEKLARVINIIRRNYDIVFVDLPGSFTNWSLSTVFAANLTIVVGTLTIPSLRHAKRQIDFLISMGKPRDSIQFVLNKVERGLFKAIDTGDAAEAIKHPVLATVSEEAASLSEAQDQGKLVYSVSKRGRFNKDIVQLANLVAGHLKEAP
ncbi:AAA family ATPase [Altererythrobacter litoralis]|uniref:AAA family ATPase n=1 Tax=Altererythrobacter litoralis TaxID=3113904 RepID=A0ABU7GDV6_9SPHN|nr:AAA family ATPase [Erythrobacteraceae bacterium 1XM1-14]